MQQITQKRPNKNRIRNSKILGIALVLAVIFTNFGFKNEYAVFVVKNIAILLIAIASLGRLYSTAFLGGFKGEKIIDSGIFSVCQNPLYLFSFIGVVGISLLSNNFVVMIIAPVGFLLIYLPLIKREQVFLTQKFGDEYKKYAEKTPLLIPNFRLYKCPPTIEVNSKAFLSGLKDAFVWFLAIPLFHFLEIAKSVIF